MTQHVAELISMFLTFPTIILAGVVVFLWGPKALVSFHIKDKDASDWFIMGVAIGFVGQVLDNLYWAIPWSLSYVASPLFEDFTNAGVYFNIFSRQSCGVVAAYCHIKSYISHQEASGNVNDLTKKATIFSVLLGILYTFLLILCRNRDWYC